MKTTDASLTELGWRSFFQAQISGTEQISCFPARVMAVYRGLVAIAGQGPLQLIPSHIPETGDAEQHPATGDWILVDRETLRPMRILQRENLFKRFAAGHGQKLQLIAANVDTVFIVTSCNNDFNIARLERYLVLAREVGVRPIIVLTKPDLAKTPGEFAVAARALESDLLVETVNARDPESAACLAGWCGVGQTVAVLGSSGVGKSTLINTLRGSDSITTQAIRASDGTGRHTTTVREMHRLEGGGWLLDTPGMRELQLSEAATGLAEVFDDIAALVLNCRFSNCKHEAEPGCAVRVAIAEEKLSPDRFQRWRKLEASIKH